MRVIWCEKLGGPEGLVVRDIDAPGPPAEGQVRVALEARGLSFVDVLMVAGEYQVKPELPFIPGSEAAGVITEVGPGVRGRREGDRVLVSGGCVDEIVVNAERTTLIPDHVSFESAAAFRSNYTTALYGLQRGQLEAGEVLLVHGAAGGVGLAAVDVGKLMGAIVIGTASSDEKLKVVKRLGADHVINYSDGFRDQVKEFTGGRGADVIYDPVGGDIFDESMRCIAPYGRILIVGFTSGRAALAKTNHLLIKDVSVIGFTIGALRRLDPARGQRNFEILMSWLQAERIHPHVSHRLPLERTADALQLIVERKVIGKVVVT